MRFPYEPRLYQQEMMQAVQRCIDEQQQLVMQASTGSGKTICALVPCVEAAKKDGRRILYLTRTNSQQQQAINELEAIGNVSAVGFQGRANMCLLAEENEAFQGGDSGAISRLCGTRKKRTIKAIRKGKRMENGCRFFAHFYQRNELPEDLTMQQVHSAESVQEYCKVHELCPYEVNKELVQDATVVIAPYIYLFDPFLREQLTSQWGFSSYERNILIVDEAHNLPDFCRHVLSPQLSEYVLDAAVRETRDYLEGNPDIVNLCNLLSDIIHAMREAYIEEGESDGFIPPGKLARAVRSAGLRRGDIEAYAEQCMEYGEVVLDAKEQQDILPRSFVRSVGRFLSSWLSLDQRWAKLVVDGGDNPRLEFYCLDASIAASVINEFHASIHMSGTLQPLEEYRDSLSLDKPELRSFPSPFPAENRKILYTRDVSTRYQGMNDDMRNQLEYKIVGICNTVDRNAAVFFSSYARLNRFLRRGLRNSIQRNIYVEQQGMSQRHLMAEIDSFRRNGGVFLSVIGGRISEGMDFPSEELEMVVIVGIPYPPPTAHQQALRSYYDGKFGNGWKYAVEAPTTRKMLQAVGRLIREESDRGIAIILDRRAKRFRRYMDLGEADDVVEAVKEFWRR